MIDLEKASLDGVPRVRHIQRWTREDEDCEEEEEGDQSSWQSLTQVMESK